ncbi:MAG: UDP-N-acetylglucosamine 1-carboxyvinyltransferase, partial [Oscillospiraceae bacterium]|nr:UDP-N-acetylglucosamine 1-carboxyvinyltransferase [Oscillospiraceae bacterium]
EPEHLAPVLPLFEEVGCRIAAGTGELRISAPPRLRRIRAVRTMPYPGFPTDAAAPMMAMACVADGTSLFIENIFQNRYNYVSHLTKMGARVKVEGQIAVAEGVPQLFGAKVACTDLRGGAALVVAALAAQGVSEISELAHLDRGYQDLVGCLTGVGAEAKRIHNA